MQYRTTDATPLSISYKNNNNDSIIDPHANQWLYLSATTPTVLMFVFCILWAANILINK